MADRPAWIAVHDADPRYAWARRAWDIAAAQDGAWFDARKADLVVENWPTWFRLTSDRFAGVPFRLLDWQAIVVRLLVGWKRPTEILDAETHEPVTRHVRVFRRLLLWVARKNGKTEFLAALFILFFVVERVPGNEGYVFAADEDQAKIPWGRIRAMLGAMPELTGGATPRVTMTAKSIVINETASWSHLLSGRPDGKHGRMPQILLGDEMHEWKTLDLVDFLRQGTGTRLQPVELYASTAGLRSNAVGLSLWDESQDIVAGMASDDVTLAVVFAADPEADWRDEDTWRQANPTIGLTPTWDYLRIEKKKALRSPRALAQFKRYHLNQWVDQEVAWLPRAKWREGAMSDWRTMAERMAGRRCYLGLDLSRRKDLTARAAVFSPEEPGEPWRVAMRFWMPEATYLAREAQERRLRWAEWRSNGALTVTPGDVIDQDHMAEDARACFDAFDVVKLGFDPWNAAKLAVDLQKHDGQPIDVEYLMEVRHGIKTLGEPSQIFETLVLEGRLDHGGHPVLDWMAANVMCRFDENMNFMPAKKRSSDNIDGISAVVTALACTIQPVEAVATSFWESA